MPSCDIMPRRRVIAPVRDIMKKHYILIDYENVQPTSLANLDREHVHVLVFIGANQSKLGTELVCALQRMGGRASYVRASGNGSNALDFHIACHLGELLAVEPGACFHIVSKDTGFDPLLKHLAERGIAVDRIKSLTELSLDSSVPRTLSGRVSAVIANLAPRGDSRPRTHKTLAGTINALFRKSLSPDEVETIIGELLRRGVVVRNGERVSYVIPKAAPVVALSPTV